MRADRLLKIILLLQTQGKMTTQALATELEVSRRTVLRDVDALSFAGIPIYAEGGHGGGVDLDENYRTSLNGLKEMEVLTLFLSDNTRPLSEIGLSEAANTTALKLLATLPSAHRQSVDHMRQRILIDPDWWWQETQPLDFWDDLYHAVFEDHCIHVIYENHQGEVVERELEPYSLVSKSSFWYLIARREGELRTYRVSRFHQLTVLDRQFERLPDYDLPQFWRERLRDFAGTQSEFPVTISMNPARLPFLKWLLPGRTRQIGATDEQSWLTLQVDMPSLNLARMLIFELGADATVLDPPELLPSVIDKARYFTDLP